MKKTLWIALAFGGLFYACGGAEEAPASGKTETVAEATTAPDGAKLYQVANCSSCHGAFGKPVLAGAKDLTDPSIALERRIEVITNGSENNAVMVAFSPKYSEAEIRAIAEYTMTFVEK
jgi:mono/diheme cytochrome c family protein